MTDIESRRCQVQDLETTDNFSFVKHVPEPKDPNVYDTKTKQISVKRVLFFLAILVSIFLVGTLY